MNGAFISITEPDPDSKAIQNLIYSYGIHISPKVGFFSVFPHVVLFPNWNEVLIDGGKPIPVLTYLLVQEVSHR